MFFVSANYILGERLAYFFFQLNIHLPQRDGLQHDDHDGCCDGGSQRGGRWGYAALALALNLHGEARFRDAESSHDAGSFPDACCCPCGRDMGAAASFHGVLCSPLAAGCADHQHGCQNAQRVASGCRKAVSSSASAAKVPRAPCLLLLSWVQPFPWTLQSCLRSRNAVCFIDASSRQLMKEAIGDSGQLCNWILDIGQLLWDSSSTRLTLLYSLP